MNIPNIALDIETLSLQPTAAIIAIAAKSFTFDEPVDATSSRPGISVIVNAASCAMFGLHFDMQTVKWWQRQSVDAKKPYTELTGSVISIQKALGLLDAYVNEIRAESPSGDILVWTQGTDFDIPILNNAYHQVFDIMIGGKKQNTLPWRHHELRDARTFIHSTLGLLYPEVKDPYSLIPKNPSWRPHEALSDVEQLIWNIRHVASLFRKAHKHRFGVD